MKNNIIKRFVGAVLLLSMIISLLVGCTDPETDVCKQNGHSPIPATCTEYSVCAVCGTQLESELGEHEFLAATCFEAKKCKICSIKEGEPLKHVYDSNKDRVCNLCNTSRDIEVGYVEPYDKPEHEIGITGTVSADVKAEKGKVYYAQVYA